MSDRNMHRQIPMSCAYCKIRYVKKTELHVIELLKDNETNPNPYPKP